MIPSAYPWGKGTPTWTYDATPNDSDKSYTVGADKIWVLKAAYYTLSATGTAGTRTPYLYIKDGSGNILYAAIMGGVAASQSNTYRVGPGLTYVGTGSNQSTGFPADILLPAGYTVQVIDAAAIDAAADDLTVALHYIEYDA